MPVEEWWIVGRRACAAVRQSAPQQPLYHHGRHLLTKLVSYILRYLKEWILILKGKLFYIKGSNIIENSYNRGIC